MMTDPIADLLTRIRNGLKNRVKEVSIPASRVKAGVARVMQEEGYLRGVQQTGDLRPELKVALKYGPRGEAIIRVIRRVSKPGCRVYRGVADIKPVQRGFGIAIVSTPKGVLSDRQCRKNRVGGEILCEIW
ncbi:MAG: 30S ribosomal protein S8 [Planctomycetota bacterium]